MTTASLQAMKKAHEALISALDANDVAAIEAAIAAFGASAEALRSGAEQGERPEAERVAELRRLSDEARMRVNFLTDAVRRRLDRLAAAGGREQAGLYAREGR